MVRVVIKPDADEILTAYPEFRASLISALETESVYNSCFVESTSGTERGITIKCRDHPAVIVPESSFHSENVINRIIQGLS